MLNEYATELSAAIAAIGSSLLTYIVSKKRLGILSRSQVTKDESIIIENIKTLMSHHNELYSKVLQELEESKISKFVIEEEYRKELNKGIERDKVIATLQIEIESLKREIIVLKSR